MLQELMEKIENLVNKDEIQVKRKKGNVRWMIQG